MAGIAVLGILACHFYVLCKITRRVSPVIATVLWFYKFVMGVSIVFNYVYSWGKSDDLKLSKKIFWIWTGFFLLLAIALAFVTPWEQWRRWREWK
jgi:hypothetical protein